MKIIQAPDDLSPRPSAACLAIGFFDGVHLGHQQVIRQALADAARCESHPVVLTFDRHPASVIAPERAPGLIYSLDHKLKSLADCGAPTTCLLTFNESLCRQPGEAFVRNLHAAWGRIDSICVGHRFRFGHRRDGDVALLQRLGLELGFQVHGLAAVSLDGEPVSSTRIRQSLREGDFDKVDQMLGRSYRLAGRVVEGDRLGRQIGFPTANLDAAGLALPPSGVYAVHAFCQRREHRAVLNIGVRPTLDASQPVLRVEVHLLDFQGDLYGCDMELGFVRHLRDERKFASLDALREQIGRDVELARRCFPAR